MQTETTRQMTKRSKKQADIYYAGSKRYDTDQIRGQKIIDNLKKNNPLYMPDPKPAAV